MPSIKANVRTVENIFKDDVRFELPYFQRRYVWEESQLNQLWEDVKAVYFDILRDFQTSKQNNPELTFSDFNRAKRDDDRELSNQDDNDIFLGAIVIQNTVASDTDTPRIDFVIDGQQRLTTLYLLMMAIANEAKNVNASVTNTLIRRVLALQLEDDHDLYTSKPKLKPTMRDEAPLDLLIQSYFDDSAEGNHPSFAPHTGVDSGTDYGNDKLTDAFNKCVEFVQEQTAEEENTNGSTIVSKSEKIAVLNHVVTKCLTVVLIDLKEHQDPNQVFERLNDAGQELGTFDKLRNIVFQGIGNTSAEATEAMNVFDRDWVPFESKLRFKQIGKVKYKKDSEEIIKPKEKDLETSKAYLWAYGKSLDPDVTEKSLYPLFRARYHDKVEPENRLTQVPLVVEDLSRFIPAWHALRDFEFDIEESDFSTKSEEGKKRIDRFRKIGNALPSDTYPYLLKLFTSYRDGETTDEKFIGVCDVIESWMVRRSFTDNDLSGIKWFFNRLWSDAKDDPARVLTAFLNYDTMMFSTDVIFEQNIREKRLYKKKLASWILRAYEEDAPAFTQTGSPHTFHRSDVYNIEHILPQTLSSSWKNNFTQEQHEKWVDVWANLVLVKRRLNQAISNAGWHEKKQLNLADSVFRQTRKVANDNPEMFDVTSLETRQQELVEFALIRWPFPKFN